jgi:hypothetical protein
VFAIQRSPLKSVWMPAVAWLAAALCLSAGSVQADVADVTSPAALHAKHVALQDQLARNQFHRPLHLVSVETQDSVAGDIHALVKHPFAAAVTTLNKPARWCDILILHINTKYCRASGSAGGDILQVNIGKKHDQAVEDAYRVDFAFRVVADAPDYLKVTLTADAGPFSTRDYRVVLEAVPAGNGDTFIHLTYAYAFGLAGRLAMQTYLGTVGSSKVGFTVVGKQPDGALRYMGGMRGLVERNTMRYYLAIEAFLGALSTPPEAQLDKRLRDWFAFTEQYPRQLHEMDRETYLDMKRKEYRRQQAERKSVNPG